MFDLLLLNLIAILIHMTLWFILSALSKNYGYVDIGWGLNFVIIVWVNFFNATTITLLGYLTLVLVSIWGLRLSYHLLKRNLFKVEDFRYQNMRKNFGKHPNFVAFFKVFMLQGILALVISLPLHALYLVTFKQDAIHYIILGFGIMMYLIGFIFEALGDYQLKVFKKDPKNKGAIMTKGLWSLTRHPNYFGDFMIWMSFSVLMISSLEFQYLYAIIGSFIMAYLLRFVSGVPLLEKKYQTNIAYQSYAKRTPIFFPKLFKERQS